MRRSPHTLALAALLALVSLPWAWVVASPERSIQWDASGYFFPYQHHFSEVIRAGRLPVWTSGLFSGFPFLADMQVGAWYPLNWPFFLAGITPRSIFLELWLHALLAALGAYALAWWLTRRRGAAVFAGVAFALSGFFSAHAEHVCLFQAAAWLPGMLWLLIRGMERREWRWIALSAIAGGAMCLAGHFQTALYLMTGMTLAAAALFPREWCRLLAALAVIGAGAGLLSAVQVLPSAELVAHSMRARLVATTFSGGILEARSLGTYLLPNAAGAFQPNYTGPQDLTQHYFFAGSLLLPLALGGLWYARRRRLLLAALVVPALWYSLGPAGGLYNVLVRLPGFASVRAPSHSMFLVTLGFVLAAAVMVARLRWRWLLVGLCLFTTAELFVWNFQRTRMVWAAGNYAEAAERNRRWLGEMARLPLPPGTRLAAPERWEGVDFGAEQFHLETTFGANALMPARYFDYLDASNRNDALLRGLGVSRYFDRKAWKVHDLPGTLPRFWAPPMVETVASGALPRRLEEHDPARAILLEGARPATAANGTARIQVCEFTEARYAVDVTARGATLLRIAVPWFPGWRATVDGRPAPIERADHALMAVRIPDGAHRLVLVYRQNYLALGAAVSLATLAALLFLAVRAPRT